MAFEEYQVPEFEIREAYGPKVDECIQGAETSARFTGSVGATYVIGGDSIEESKASVERIRYVVEEYHGPLAEECEIKARYFAFNDGFCRYRIIGKVDSWATVRRIYPQGGIADLQAEYQVPEQSGDRCFYCGYWFWRDGPWQCATADSLCPECATAEEAGWSYGPDGWEP